MGTLGPVVPAREPSGARTDLFDTSILIRLKEAETVDGFTTILNLMEFPRAAALPGLQVIYPTVREQDHALELARLMFSKGKPVPAVDLLLAAVAVARDLTLRTTDRHFRDIQQVESRLRLRLE